MCETRSAKSLTLSVDSNKCRLIRPCLDNVCSVRPSIVSIISNHPTDAMKRCEKDTYEKIATLRKCADGYAATSLTFYSSVCVFFSFWVFFYEHSRFTGLQGRGRLSL